MAAYVGRFAPSPTGPLHIGTLATAVAGFLHSRQSGGQWLVRIEDIDPPREVPGSADDILRALEKLALFWDGEVQYQSRRVDRILSLADSLITAGKAYYCTCSRREIAAVAENKRYPGTCRGRQLLAADAAARLRTDGARIRFVDGIQGAIDYDIDAVDGDFVIARRDGLPAYHLAVVADDAWQGISDVVRGADLLHSTPLHIHLQHALNLPTPRYWHIPVLTDTSGNKLSKSSGAAPVDTTRPDQTAARVLELLGYSPPSELAGAPAAELWHWATESFAIETLGVRHLVVPDADVISDQDA